MHRPNYYAHQAPAEKVCLRECRGLMSRIVPQVKVGTTQLRFRMEVECVQYPKELISPDQPNH